MVRVHVSTRVPLVPDCCKQWWWLTLSSACEVPVEYAVDFLTTYTSQALRKVLYLEPESCWGGLDMQITRNGTI